MLMVGVRVRARVSVRFMVRVRCTLRVKVVVGSMSHAMSIAKRLVVSITGRLQGAG